MLHLFINILVFLSFSKRFLLSVQYFFKLVLHLDFPDHVYKNKLRLVHSFLVVINPLCKIGRNVIIFHNVTLGSMRERRRTGVPEIKDIVIVFTSFVIAGNVKIGKEAIMGAGSVVTEDVEPFTVVAGNSAKAVEKL